MGSTVRYDLMERLWRAALHGLLEDLFERFFAPLSLDLRSAWSDFLGLRLLIVASVNTVSR